MLYQINEEDVINPAMECHYAFYDQIDTSQYPQAHDFHEIALVVNGKMSFQMNKEEIPLEKGSLIYTRPGDIHAKIPTQQSQHINLAFSQHAFDSLFEYLYTPEAKERFLSVTPFVPTCQLTSADTALMTEQLARLNLLPVDSPDMVRTAIRKFIFESISHHFMPALDTLYHTKQQPQVPAWFAQIIKELDNQDNLCGGMEFLVARSGCTSEHICRSFKKYLHMTPITYINAKRLGCAANMLAHTDRSITDILYDVGFSSASHFYSLFKKEFGVTPRQYRERAFVSL